MGVDRGYISGLELGQRNPTIITLWHAAQALGALQPNAVSRAFLCVVARRFPFILALI